MEEICTIRGTQVPRVPAIPPDSVPNLESIRKVYDIAFAPGLDKFLESSSHWYTQYGFDLLASNRNLLGLMLAYLTLVSNNHDKPINHNPTLVSQEARVTWALLSLCTIPTPSNQPDDEADVLARRFRTVESILTGEPLEANTMAATAISMSEFVHQEPEDNDMMDTTAGAAAFELNQQPQLPIDPSLMATAAPSPFARQVARRTIDFWSTLETIASSQPPAGTINAQNTSEITNTLIPQLKTLLDGKENRDILYSLCLLGWGENLGDPSSERELARRFLQNEAGGRAGGVVFGALAGMCQRAHDLEEGHR